jgi:hypothetical protein
MSHHFQDKKAFDPYAEDPQGIDYDDNLNPDYKYNEGRYDDFFVIPNEQYDGSQDDDGQKYDDQ